LEELSNKVQELTTRVDTFGQQYEDMWQEEKLRNDELARILERVVEIGLRGGWTEFESTPLQLPRIQLTPHRPHPPPTDETSASQNPNDNDHISNPTPSS